MSETIPYVLRVRPIDDEWHVLEDGVEDSLNVYATRWEAEEHALDLAEAAGYGEIVLYDDNDNLERSYPYVPSEAAG
jgi:hypothetical protein